LDFSPQIDQVMAAIGRVQAAVPFVDKTKTADIEGKQSGVKRKETYAPFEEIVGAVVCALVENGLAWSQGGAEGNGASQWVETLIVHSASGQWIRSRIRVESARAGFRDVGAAWSYWRRQGFLAAIGIVAKGEDAEAGPEYAKEAKPPRQEQRVNRAARPAHAPEDVQKLIEDTLIELRTATATRIEELSKGLMGEDNRTVVPRADAERVRAAFQEARARVAANGQ